MKGTLFALGLCALISCQTTPTPYQPLTNFEGYQHTQINSNSFTVSFQGNRNTTGQQAIDHALRHSAELALQNQCRYFTVTQSQIAGKHRFEHQHSKPAISIFNYREYKVIMADRRLSAKLFNYDFAPVAKHQMNCATPAVEENNVYDACEILKESICSISDDQEKSFFNYGDLEPCINDTAS